jgi:hypothetical protein
MPNDMAFSQIATHPGVVADGPIEHQTPDGVDGYPRRLVVMGVQRRACTTATSSE